MQTKDNSKNCIPYNKRFTLKVKIMISLLTINLFLLLMNIPALNSFEF